MLSTLTNLLPSSLQPAQQQNTATSKVSYETDNEYDNNLDDDDDAASLAPSEAGLASAIRGPKKSKAAHETFILVRPPPSKSNHPLNLQVQLVPPKESRRPSTSDPRTPTSESLSRSNSITTNPSESTTSINSTSTTASTISTTRRSIVPLYNLQAHNVMTNVVVDAGTDAKIAKFQRRGLEMIDLAWFDCVEVWPSPHRVSQQQKQKVRQSVKSTTSTAPLVQGQGQGSAQQTPASSAVSLSSAGHSLLSTNDPHHRRPSPPEISIIGPSSSPSIPPHQQLDHHLSPIPGTPNPNNNDGEDIAPPFSSPPATSKRKMFGKLFSRRGANDKVDASAAPSKTSGSPTTSTFFPSSGSAGEDISSPRSITNFVNNLSNSSSSRSPSRSSHLRTESGGGNNKDSESLWKRHSKNLSFSLPLSSGGGSSSSPTTATATNATNGIQGSPTPRLSTSSTRSRQHERPASSYEPSLSLSANEYEGGRGSRRSSMHFSQNDLGSHPYGVAPGTPITAEQRQEKEKEQKEQLRPAVLGLQPLLSGVVTTTTTTTTNTSSSSSNNNNTTNTSSSTNPSNNNPSSNNATANGGAPPTDNNTTNTNDGSAGSAQMYVWAVRKWIKGSGESGLLSSLSGFMSARSIAANANATGQMEDGDREGSGFAGGNGYNGGGGGGGGGGGNGQGGGQGGVELRFEWRKSLKSKSRKKKKSGRGKSARPTSAVAGGDKTSAQKAGHRRRKSDGGAAAGFDNDEEDKDAGAGEEGEQQEGEQDGEDDAGEQSDPEDSETPWVCTLKVRRTGGYFYSSSGPTAQTQGHSLSPTPSRISVPPSTGGGGGGGGTAPSSIGSARGRRLSSGSYGGVVDEHGVPIPQPQFKDKEREREKEKESRTIRIKVATLSPTPHHPKVVGMLKIPFPLSDLDFSPALPGGVVVRQRVAGQQPEPLVSSTANDNTGLPKGFTLTAEEIKDVVSVSGLWLVVREGFGGIGKDKRKGDGWKLRG